MPSRAQVNNVSLHQQIADNAQAATGAVLVHFAWLDAETHEVYVGAMAGGQERVQRAIKAAGRFVPNFDPLTHVRFAVDVNRWNAGVYSGSGAILTTFEQIVEGTVSPVVARIAQRIAGLRYTFTCPLQQGSEVIGSLAFHFGRAPTQAQQRTCEAFARQASLTLENALLREQTARTLEALSEGILRVDTANRVVFANPAAAELCGCGVDDLIGRPINEIFQTTDEFDGFVCRLDMTHVPVEYTAAAVAWGTVFVLRDSRARIEAERARQAMASAQRLRALGQMAGGIAHDLNQALALISGYSQLAHEELEQAPPSLDRLRGQLEVVSAAAHDSAHAIRRLLAWARTSQAGPFELVDVHQLLEDVARLTAPRWRDATQMEGRPVQLTVESDQTATIEGDPAGLRDALRNLVFNATDALTTGGSIRLRTRSMGSEVTIDVVDTGPGIAPEIRPRIFDPFFTTKGEAGTGLGLAQVLATVEQHHGRLELDSTPGHGTTFSLVFPAARIVPGVSAPATPTGAPGRTLRILAVDDEERLARLAAHLLTPLGHRVAVATSGEQALEVLHGDHFELLITDLGLGAGMNGWELAEIVRGRYPNIRIILATGWGAAISDRDAAAHGVDGVIAKPYTAADLRARVAKLATD